MKETLKLNREQYLNKLIQGRANHKIKFVYGQKHSGKSYLVRNLFREALIENGLLENQFFYANLSGIEWKRYSNPALLENKIRDFCIQAKEQAVIVIDNFEKIKKVETHSGRTKISRIDLVKEISNIENVDFYLVCDDSSSFTEEESEYYNKNFCKIEIMALTYKEFCQTEAGTELDKYRDFSLYGSTTRIALKDENESKKALMEGIIENSFKADIFSKYGLKGGIANVELVLRMVASNTSKLTNPLNIREEILKKYGASINTRTIKRYLDLLEQSYIISAVNRYEVKSRKVMETPLKYYFTDSGIYYYLCKIHNDKGILETVVFNELKKNGYEILVGFVESRYKKEKQNLREQLEVDFLVRKGKKRLYIQTEPHIESDEHRMEIIKPYLKVKDSFRKLVIVQDEIEETVDEYGIIYLNVKEFLLGNYM